MGDWGDRQALRDVSKPSFSSSRDFVKPSKRLKRTVKIFPPWDLLRGRCVFKHRSDLKVEASQAALSHFAPNCATFSRAREIPIPGVKNPPRPLRDIANPEGIPEELGKLSSKSLKRLRDDTTMANLSADMSWDIAEDGRGFTLEHPGNSIARSLKSWRRLSARPDVHEIEYHTCRFAGSKRRKFQVLITNRPEFRNWIGLTCEGHICQRTQEAHQRWRPAVSCGKVIQFQTGDEREYPIGFCEAYARAAQEILEKEAGNEPSFLEVFSGPNAPLSHSIGRTTGAPVPGGRLNTGEKGEKSEFQRLKQLALEIDPEPKGIFRYGGSEPPPLGDKVTKEEPYNRLVAIQAAKQPGYGKRIQLIPDGLKDPCKHLEEAMKLEHPFDHDTVLKTDHSKSLESMSGLEELEIQRRLKTLGEWKLLASTSAVQEKQKAHELFASECAKRLGRKPRTALMEILGKRYHIEDRDVPKLCLTGMPIVGETLSSPFFLPYDVPASMTISELLKSAKQRATKILGRVKMMGDAGGQKLCDSIWAKTMKEVDKGTMAGPFSRQELERRHGPFINIVPSFGLEQGEGKYRRIDDHSASNNNHASHRKQKIQMAMADYLMVMISSAAKIFKQGLVIGTEDMAGAYRQVPLPDSQVRIAITAVYHWESGQARLFEIYGQPFGAAAAVPNFYRLAEWACRLCTRGYNLLIDHFFDDYFVVLRPKEADSTMFCVRETFALLGLTLDPEKSQPPAEIAWVLGVAFNTRSLQEQRVLLVEPKPSRIQNLCFMIDNVLKSGNLSPSLAASLLGKFGFLCSTMFGKVGRCCTGALRNRQYSSEDHQNLTSDIKTCLNLMKLFVQEAPARALKIENQDPPIILYTDASDVPERGDCRWVVGGVLFDATHSPHLEYFSWVVPQEVILNWIPKTSYMGQLEILACPVAISTWRSRLSGRRVLLFVDNDSAASNLVRGYSPKTDSSALVGQFWLLASQTKTEVYIDRVESKSNLSDGPSRLDFELVSHLGATKVPPNSSFLSHPFQWFVKR